MKLPPVLMISLLSATVLYGQQSRTAGGGQAEHLLKRMEAIEKDNLCLKQQMRARDSIIYTHLRQDIIRAYTYTPRLEFDFRNTTEKMAVTGIFTKLMQVNNPTSDILGFRFTDIISSTCEKHFLDKLKNEKDKKRFGHIIQKIINNPVISGLAGSNPVTSVIASVISIIASFTTSSTEISREGNKVKDIEVSQEDVFGEETIASFMNDLQVYIHFYEALSDASNQYLAGLDYLDIKYTWLMQSVKDYEARLYAILETRDQTGINRMNAVLPDPERERVDFSFYIHHSLTVRAISEAKEFTHLQKSVHEFKKEYNQLLLRFLEQYCVVLDMARDFPDGVVDVSSIDALIGDISLYTKKLKGDNEGKQDLFLPW